MTPRDHTVVVISASQPFVSCPGCKRTVKVSDYRPADGAKVLCAGCGERWVLKVSETQRGNTNPSMPVKR